MYSLNRYGLELHPDKTALIQFGKSPLKSKACAKNGTFDFLGFTFYWGNRLKGYRVIKKKTARKRLNRFLKMTWNWCKENRHEPIRDQYNILCAKLRGFYQYYGLRSNYKALEVAYEHTESAWRYWLSRRSHTATVLFEELREVFPLRQAVEKCDACIFIAMHRALESSWCGAELGAFWKARKPVVVYLADSSLQEEDLPPIVQGDVWERRISRVVARTQEIVKQVQG